MENAINDKFFLDLAYKEALKSLEKKEVPVGAIIVKDGKIIGKGHNLRISKNNALYHAEIVAIEQACKNTGSWRLDGATMYVTLEPCLMCAGAIMQSRISEVVFSAVDKKGGCVISNIRVFDTGLPFRVKYRYLEDERAVFILKEFFKNLRKGTTLSEKQI